MIKGNGSKGLNYCFFYIKSHSKLPFKSLVNCSIYISKTRIKSVVIKFDIKGIKENIFPESIRRVKIT